MNETLQTIKARRSVRAYTEQQVSAEDLNLILEAATYAPSGMHLETWHFTAIQNKEVLEELNDKIKGAFAKSDDLHTRERGHSQTYCVCPAYAGHTPKAFQIVQKYKFSFTNQVFGVLFFQRVQVPYERIETPNR